MATVLALVAGTPALAGDYGDRASNKLARGLANLTTGWLEVPKNISNESRRSNVGVGLTWGSIKGGLHTVGRTAVGAFDTATFYVPSKEVVHSTYVWDDFDKETTYGSR